MAGNDVMSKEICAAQSNEKLADLIPKMKSIDMQPKHSEIKEYKDIVKVAGNICHKLWNECEETVDDDLILEVYNKVLDADIGSPKDGYKPVYKAFAEFCKVIEGIVEEIKNSRVRSGKRESSAYNPMAWRPTPRPVVREPVVQPEATHNDDDFNELLTTAKNNKSANSHDDDDFNELLATAKNNKSANSHDDDDFNELLTTAKNNKSANSHDDDDFNELLATAVNKKSVAPSNDSDKGLENYSSDDDSDSGDSSDYDELNELLATTMSNKSKDLEKKEAPVDISTKPFSEEISQIIQYIKEYGEILFGRMGYKEPKTYEEAADMVKDICKKVMDKIAVKIDETVLKNLLDRAKAYDAGKCSDKEITDAFSRAIDEYDEGFKCLERKEKAKREKRYKKYLTEVFSTYDELVKRVHSFVKDVENESPDSLDDLKKATRNMCEKMKANKIEIDEKIIRTMESSIDDYNKDHNEDTFKNVMDSYKKLSDEISKDLDLVIDDMRREDGRATEFLYQGISGMLKDMQEDAAHIIGPPRYRAAENYKQAATMVRDIYERILEKARVSRDNEALVLLSDRLKSYYNNEIDYIELVKAFFSLKKVIYKAIDSVPKPEPPKEETPAEREKRHKALLTEVLSMYDKLAKRAHTIIKDLKKESPANLDDVKKATRDMCEKIKDYEVEMNEKTILSMESSIDTYNSNPDEKNGRIVIISYKELFDEISEYLDYMFDNFLVGKEGYSPVRIFREDVIKIFEEMKQYTELYFGENGWYREPKTYREAAETIKDIYERVAGVYGDKKNEAILKTLSRRLEEYYAGKCNPRELGDTFLRVRKAFRQVVGSNEVSEEYGIKETLFCDEIPEFIEEMKEHTEFNFGDMRYIEPKTYTEAAEMIKNIYERIVRTLGIKEDQSILKTLSDQVSSGGFGGHSIKELRDSFYRVRDAFYKALDSDEDEWSDSEDDMEENDPYFDQALSIYGELVGRARAVVKGVENESPTSMDGIKKATKNICDKMVANKIAISLRSLNVVERLMDDYTKNPNEDNGKKVIDNYRKLSGMLSENLRYFAEGKERPRPASPKNVQPVKPAQQVRAEVPEVEQKKPKKDTSGLQGKLETIFTNILKNHFSKDGKENDPAKDFNRVHTRIDDITEASCPKWFSFMESVFTKLGTNKKYVTNKILVAILLASCCAADDTIIASAVCKAVKKITKDVKFKDEEYMTEAEGIRQGIKDKISSLKDPKGLVTIVKGALRTSMGLDSALITLIFDQMD